MKVYFILILILLLKSSDIFSQHKFEFCTNSETELLDSIYISDTCEYIYSYNKVNGSLHYLKGFRIKDHIITHNLSYTFFPSGNFREYPVFYIDDINKLKDSISDSYNSVFEVYFYNKNNTVWYYYDELRKCYYKRGIMTKETFTDFEITNLTVYEDYTLKKYYKGKAYFKNINYGGITFSYLYKYYSNDNLVFTSENIKKDNHKKAFKSWKNKKVEKVKIEIIKCIDSLKIIETTKQFENNYIITYSDNEIYVSKSPIDPYSFSIKKNTYSNWSDYPFKEILLSDYCHEYNYVFSKYWSNFLSHRSDKY